MKTLVIVTLLGLLVYMASARRGSISNNLFEDDVNDDDGGEDGESEMEVEQNKNPCARKRCHRGEECIVNDKREAKCVCAPDCSFQQYNNGRFQVCSNKNVTYPSECALDRDHCLCKRKSNECTMPGVRKIQLDYYGACQDMTPCEESESVQFPERMRDWLFIVMEEMANRAQIGEYLDLLEEAANDENHAYAVIWKFCDLDTDPQDRKVSRRELQYTVRSLRAMEHCLMPFLDDCDANDDRQITLQEWGLCLGLSEDKISDRCRAIQNNSSRRRRR